MTLKSVSRLQRGKRTERSDGERAQQRTQVPVQQQFLLSHVAHVVTILTCTQEVAGSNDDWGFRNFPQSLRANLGLLPKIRQGV
jgi:hypothetical protein